MQSSALFGKALLTTAIVVGALSASVWRAEAGPYTQTNLVSDLSTVGATITDPDLVNPWGISHSSTSPFWISNQGANPAGNRTTTLYTVTGQTNVTKVNINPPAGDVIIPPAGTGAVGPTGQVNNTNTGSFLIPTTDGGDGNYAHFMFGNLNGTISAWDTGTTAHIVATTTSATYTGLAINQAQTQIYAANDAGPGSVNAFNSSFMPATLPTGAFSTPTSIAAAGLVPFNVQDIGGKIYVEYAPSGRANQQNATAGQGAVVVFNEDGTSPQILIPPGTPGSNLAAPWGIALAPAGFGPFGGDWLVGNFSYIDSEINAYDPTNFALVGTISIDPGAGQTPGGLWALNFGIGGSNGDPNTLYVTDGIDGETHGLFAAFTVAAVPEPSGLALLGTALAFFGVCRFRSRRQAQYLAAQIGA